MGVADGQAVNAAVTNGALASKFFNNTFVGIQTLNHPTSGGIINNVQQSLNDVITESGQNAVAVADHETRLDILEPQVASNTSEVGSLRTLSGTALGDNDNGTFTGSTIADNVTTKVALQSLETAVELRELLSNKGIANGYAPLNASGVIDAAFLPSYVDDVLEYADFASFPVSGETGKIYIALDTEFIYRWSGTIYVQLNVGGVVTVQGRSGAAILYKIANDNTAGSNATLASIPISATDLTSVIRLTNASLVSVDMIPAGYSGQPFVLVNRTGVPLDINNDVGGTAANRILTGTGSNLTLEPDASLNLIYDDTTARWSVVGGSGSGGSSIATPAVTVVFRVPVFGDVTGTQLDQSPMSINASGVSTGLTDLTVATVRTSLNKVEGTQSNTDFDLDADGTGAVRALAPFKLNEALRYTPQTDSSATGTNATLAAPLTTILIVDNTSLVSIEGITAGSAWQEITLVNKTGNPLQIFNETGTAANQIVNSNLQNILLGVNGSLKLIYDAVLSKWFSQRTDFVTLPFTSDWITYTPTISTDSGSLPSRSSEVFRYRVDGPDYLITARVAFSGTGTGGGFYIFTLPNGHTIRTSVVSNSNFDSMGVFGVGGWYDQSSSPQGPILISGKGTTNTLACYGSDKATGAIIPTNSNIGNGDFFNFTIRVPVNELSQNTTSGIANQAILETLTATSSVKTPTAQSTFQALTGNTVTLKAGKVYDVQASGMFASSGGSPNYQSYRIGLYGANGADSGTTPATLDTISTLQMLTPAINNVTEMTFSAGVFDGIVASPVVRIRALSDTVIYAVTRIGVTTTPANARITAYINAREVPFTNVAIVTGPISLGTRVVSDDQTNATTTAEFFQNGPFIEMLGSMVFTGTTTGGEVNMTIPAEFAASADYNAGATRPSIGIPTLNDASAPYGGGANLTSTTNIRLYANGSGSASNISTTNPFTWVAGDTIFFHLRWKRA